MKACIFAYSKTGLKTAERVREILTDSPVYVPERLTAEGTAGAYLKALPKPSAPLYEEMFQSCEALVFVGALGIAVRSIAPFVKDKKTDPAVICIDELASYVIPVLSGHLGGANALAEDLAEALSSTAVITTATDINRRFSVDSFAAENRLSVMNREGIRQVSVKALEKKKITLSVKDFPPKEKVDVIVADETDAEYSLLLSPKKYTVGIGMKRDKDAGEADRLFRETLEGSGIATRDVYAICTIDVKEEEPAITALRDKYRIPVISFDAALLEKAEGDFTASDFVKKTVGVDNVCERAALLGAGCGGELILKKRSRDGMTIAVAKRGNRTGGTDIWVKSL